MTLVAFHTRGCRFESDLLHLPMTQIRISRTRALKAFKKKMGSPVRNLNSVIVGLCAVGKGEAKKPAELAISWEPVDLHRAEFEAREFSIRSLMVFAYDALDHYLNDLGEEPSPLRDSRLKSVLRAEKQFEVEGETITSNSIDSLASELKGAQADKEKLRKLLKGFTERYSGKSRDPSIRMRLSSLYEHCMQIPVCAGRPPMPRPSYFSAIELLIAWRNVLVHDAESDQLGSNALEVLLADKDDLQNLHAGIDISTMIDRYNLRVAPSLKEVSTLVSIFMRFVSAIDAVILDDCEFAVFFQDAVRFEIKRAIPTKDLAKSWSRILHADRVRKATTLVGKHGFSPSSFDVKAGAYQGKLSTESDLEFLNFDGVKAFRLLFSPLEEPTQSSA